MPAESPTLITSWRFDPAVREEVLAEIHSVVQGVVRKQAGFVSCRLYESSEGGAVLVAVQMQTVQDRQRLMEVPQVRAAMRKLRRLATSRADLYTLVEGIDAAP